MLSRAGITNVYQYGEEVLSFGGGRLLLRGVNGSGKSTAMNMLLPFLLDADVRRIDAAGEQAGVLRSWMLAGRDETQPTGYLWLELVRGSDHLTFGCGIRANRNTDAVNHWWFLTERRPGFDLELVRTHGGRARTPLSAEELRAELGAHQVWSKDQRGSYRAAVRDRLYGGVDLDQHLRLLHVVRNPRVGDRVDVELPQHLHDALPQLSEAAIDDAATPLEQLEEHRRNVSQLSETVAALDALLATYTNHARAELRRRADDALAVTDRHRRAVGSARAAETEVTEATDAAKALEGAITRLTAEEDRLRAEIDQLRASEAYRSVTELDERRKHVQWLKRSAAQATEDADGEAGRTAHAVEVVQSEAQATIEAARLADLQTEQLAAVAAAARLTATIPARPEAVVAPLTVAGQVVAVPASPLPTDGEQAGLAEIRRAAHTRRAEADDASAALDLIDEAERKIADRDRERRQAETDAGRAAEKADDAVGQRTAMAEEWRGAATAWVVDLRAHVTPRPMAEAIARGPSPAVPAPELAEADVVADHRDLHSELVAAIDIVRRRHDRQEADLQVRQATDVAVRDDARVQVDELAARREPEPPSAPWQTRRSGLCLAELIDFADHLDASERAGVEAALEAAGLLAAEVRADGSVAAGDLLLRPAGSAVTTPLSQLVTVVIPGEHADRIDPQALTAVLDRISTEPDDLDDGHGAATITTEGGFRVGPLRGAHTKPAAEHVGVTARRAALERMRAEAADRLAEAESVLARTDAELAAVTALITDADALRDAVPDTTAVAEAVMRASQTMEAREEAARRHELAIIAHREAETAHGRAVDDARRICTTLGLPHDRAGLASIAQSCRDLPGQADALLGRVHALAAAVDRWSAAGERWADLATSASNAARWAEEAADTHRREDAALATLEDAIGLDVQLLLSTLASTEGRHHEVSEERTRHHQAQPAAGARVGTALATLDQARAAETGTESECRDVLDVLRATTAVPGLLDAAISQAGPLPSGPTHDSGDSVDARPPILPTVAASPDGLRQLARALHDLVPESGTAVSADGVRSAVLQRRANLGAGWDAVAVQPDPAQPLSVEVNGPLGRQMALASAAAVATGELATKQGLLSAQQHDALRNLLQGLIAKEVAEKLHAATELVRGMNDRLRSVRTTHGIGVTLRWKRRDDLGGDMSTMVDLLARPPDLRSPDDDARLVAALSVRIGDARIADPDADYRTLIASVLDYRDWHRVQVVVHRSGAPDSVLNRRTPLSEGEKKIVSYQPLFAAVAASCDALAERAPDAPRFILLDDAFAKVSEDNHAKLFGLLVELDLDFIVTSERLEGTHATVPSWPSPRSCAMPTPG